MAKLSIRNGVYILRWTEPGEGRKSKSLGKVAVLPKRDAENVLRAKELELSTGRQMLGMSRGSVPNFGTYCAEYLTWRAMNFPDSQERVEQIIEDHLKPEFEFKALDSIRAGQVEDWMRRRLLKVKPETVGKELRTLKAILHHAIKRDVLAKDPLRTVQAPRSLESAPHRFYEAHELQAIYAVANPRHAAVWKLMANTGMRRGESMALKWEHVGEAFLRVLSTSEDRTKSGKWRQIPLSDGARAALEVLAGDESRIGHVLPRMAPESLSREFARDAAKAGYPGGIHDLRHSYITHLVRAGVPLRVVQALAGHADFKTTLGYSHHTPGTEPAAVLELAL